MRNAVRSVLALAMLLVLASASLAKPAPPMKLSGMFKKFLQLEEAIEEKEWEEARRSAGEILGQYKQLKDSLEPAVGKKLVDDFGDALASLGKNVASKDPKSALNSHVVSQGFFLDVMDAFQFDAPPVMTLVKQYVGIAEEANGRGDFGNVAHEMEELDVLGPRIRKAAREQGIRPEAAEKFSATVKEIRAAAERRQKDAVKAGLGELRKLFPSIR